MTRSQDWIRTFTGRKFYPLDPQPEDVCIEDIAHALSMLCRYTGHVSRFYSVAEHSCLVTGAVCDTITDGDKDEVANLIRWALLHDAAEAYVGDMTRPLKHQPEMSIFRETEAGVMRAICLRFGLRGEEPAIVRQIDKQIIGTEARLLKYGEGLATVDPLPDMLPNLRQTVIGVSPEIAERSFLRIWESTERALEPRTQWDLMSLARATDAYKA